MLHSVQVKDKAFKNYELNSSMLCVGIRIGASNAEIWNAMTAVVLIKQKEFAKFTFFVISMVSPSQVMSTPF